MKNISRDSSREQLNTYYSEVLKCENSLSMLDEISSEDVLYDDLHTAIFRLTNRDHPFEICSVVKQQERLDELYEILAEVEEAIRIEVSKMESLELWSDSYPDLVKYLKQ
jgi:hypothetical protein